MAHEHMIVVSGKAERKVQPDRARWAISVGTVAPGEREAFTECSRGASELMARLRAAVGDDGEVATAHVRVAPRWEAGRKRYVGYEASTKVTATSSLDLAGKVTQAAMSGSVASVSGPAFEISNEEAVRDELLASAVAAARAKAERLAGAARRELGRVVSVRERDIEGGPAGGLYVSSMALEDRDAEPEITAADQAIAAEVIVGFECAD